MQNMNKNGINTILFGQALLPNAGIKSTMSA
jgi:hypothetical protein